jgi:hypothetical protein
MASHVIQELLMKSSSLKKKHSADITDILYSDDADVSPQNAWAMIEQ